MCILRFIPYCQVVEASNGQEALHLLDEVKPNLILSDVMMPGMLFLFLGYLLRFNLKTFIHFKFLMVMA